MPDLKSSSRKSFLVFSGGNDRAVLGFLRALRRCRKAPHIVARTSSDLILRTKFRQHVKYVREGHELNMEIFSKCVRRIREQVGDQIFVVLPSTEFFNHFLLQYRDEITSLGCEIPLAEAAVYALLTNKRTSTNLFAEAGIDVPREFDRANPDAIAIVAKPKTNLSVNQSLLYPQMLSSRAQLESFAANNEPENYFFQEFVVGQSKYLLLYLARQSDVNIKWSQRNLLQQPGGKSILLAEPSALHQTEFATSVVELLRREGFWGLGMVEIIDTADRRVFIEMNPRIWGPVQLCIDQAQPLLEAFIGDALHDDPMACISDSPKIVGSWGRYFWFGGLIGTLAAGNAPVWLGPRHSLVLIVLKSLRFDIYLRMDSWSCFVEEMKQAIKLAWNRAKTKG